MSGIKVKICGVNHIAALEAAVEAGADWIGFVFFPPSPRFVTSGQAAALAARMPPGLPRVGLFVNPDESQIADVLSVLRLDALQLYGPAPIGMLRARFGVPVWHATGIAAAADLPHAGGGADALVLEAKPPPAATRPGGNAASFDWALLRGWAAPVPWILAGGLAPANVAGAIRVTGATAVDVSSGVETAPGVKDPTLIREFIRRAKQAGND
jgi:phosphoribosylanthranilate isomerase